MFWFNILNIETITQGANMNKQQYKEKCFKSHCAKLKKLNERARKENREPLRPQRKSKEITNDELKEIDFGMF